MNNVINLNKNSPADIQVIMITGKFELSDIAQIIGSTYNKNGNIVVDQNLNKAYIKVGESWNIFRDITPEKSSERLKKLIDGTITEITPDDLGKLMIIPQYKLTNLPNLTKVTLSDNLADYDYYCGAFSGAPLMKEFNMGNGLDQEGFEDLARGLYNGGADEWLLDIFVIGKKVETISDNSRSMMYIKTKEYQISPENESLCLIDGGVYSQNGTVLDKYPALKEGSFQLPLSTTAIANGAFAFCQLSSIALNNTITVIPDGAFYECNNLEDITLNDFITSVGEYAFYRCRKIKSVNLSNLITSIKQFTFAGCTNLESIEIPESVTTIGNQAFDACANLTNIIIPSKVQSLGNWLFDDCTALQTVTVLPTTPPSLGYSAFPDNIQTIYVPAESVETYKSAARWSSYASKIQPIQS